MFSHPIPLPTSPLKGEEAEKSLPFEAEKSLPLEAENSLPFKGRVRVGMGYHSKLTKWK